MNSETDSAELAESAAILSSKSLACQQAMSEFGQAAVAHFGLLLRQMAEGGKPLLEARRQMGKVAFRKAGIEGSRNPKEVDARVKLAGMNIDFTSAISIVRAIDAAKVTISPAAMCVLREAAKEEATRLR